MSDVLDFSFALSLEDLSLFDGALGVGPLESARGFGVLEREPEALEPGGGVSDLAVEGSDAGGGRNKNPSSSSSSSSYSSRSVNNAIC